MDLENEVVGEGGREKRTGGEKEDKMERWGRLTGGKHTGRGIKRRDSNETESPYFCCMARSKPSLQSRQDTRLKVAFVIGFCCFIVFSLRFRGSFKNVWE